MMETVIVDRLVGAAACLLPFLIFWYILKRVGVWDMLMDVVMGGAK